MEVARTGSMETRWLSHGVLSSFFIVFFLWSCVMAEGAVLASDGEQQLSQPVRAAYWPSFTAGFVPLASVNASLFTHMLYAFAQVNPNTFSVEVEAGEEAQAGAFTPAMKAVNPGVKTLLSIGGAGANASALSRALASSSARRAFVQSSVALARAHAFDGLDVDWEFPRSEQDMNSFAAFLADWRSAAAAEAAATSAAPLLLSAAVYYSSSIPAVNGTLVPYPIAAIVQNLDLVHIMAYDYHGSWENLTGEHTALAQPNSNFSTSFGLDQWISAGLPPRMAIVGLASYGHSWTLANSSGTGVGSVAAGAGPAQPTSRQAGIFFYFEIEDFIAAHSATVVHDNVTSSAYCFAGDVWVGYDDPVTLGVKLRAFQGMGLGGYFMWSVSYDNRTTWSLSNAAAISWKTETHYPSSSSNSLLPRIQYAWLTSLMWIVLAFMHAFA